MNYRKNEMHTSYIDLVDKITDTTAITLNKNTKEMIKYIDAQNKKIQLEIDSKMTLFMNQIMQKLDNHFEQLRLTTSKTDRNHKASTLSTEF